MGLLRELPPPPPGRTGWPWDVETTAAEGALPGLSIVTPSFNHGRFLEQTIRSVLLQNYPQLQYVVIDGGSTDESARIIDRYRPWLAYAVSESDRGQAHALNKGFEYASAAFRAYINSDDYYLPGAFHAAARAAQGSTGELLIAGECETVDADGDAIGIHRGSIRSFDDLADLWGVWSRGGYWPQPAVFWRHDNAAAAPRFREDLHYVMDYEYWGQLLARGARIVDVPERLAAFREHPGQKSGDLTKIMGEAVPVLEKWLHSSQVTRSRHALIDADLRYVQMKQCLGGAEGTPIATMKRRARIARRVLLQPGLLRSRELARDVRRVLAPRRRARAILAFVTGRVLESTFRDIARQRAWGSGESVSGPGSSLRQTRVIREQIPRLLQELGCKTLLDAPCGDFHWLSHTQLPAQYLGCDIVTELVQQNRTRYGSDRVRFFTADISQDQLPSVDLVLCRDCLVHLPDAGVRKVIRNFARSGSRYLLTTTFPAHRANADIAPGQWRPLNLQAPPFNLPPPIKLLNEECTEFDGAYRDKSLGLWSLAEL